jgi:hypothetical protein
VEVNGNCVVMGYCVECWEFVMGYCAGERCEFCMGYCVVKGGN